MMNYLNDNWRTILVAVLCVVGFTVAYMYVRRTRSQSADQQQMQNQQQMQDQQQMQEQEQMQDPQQSFEQMQNNEQEEEGVEQFSGHSELEGYTASPGNYETLDQQPMSVGSALDQLSPQTEE